MSLTSKLCKGALILGVVFGLSGCFESSQERAERHYQSGLTLLSDGDLPRAIVEFRNTLQLDDANFEAYRQLASANRSLGRLGEAYGDFLNLVERAPEDIEGRIALSELAFWFGDWEEFARHGEMAVKLDPSRPDIEAINLGMNYRSALMEKKIAERAGLVVAAEALARDLPNNSILRQILLDARIAERRFDDALVLVSESIAETPQTMRLYTLRLELLSRLGKHADLEAELRNMLDVFQDEKGPKETYLRYLISRDRPQDAQSYLEDLVLSAKPEERNAAMVTLLQFIQQTESSESALIRVDELLAGTEVENGLLHTFRASLIFDMGRREEGTSVLEDVLVSETLKLDDVARLQSKTALARMLIFAGNEERARTLISEVLQADARRSDALMIRANWAISDDDTDAAIADLRTVLDDSADNATAMVLLARAYEREGNRDLMLSFLSQAVEASNNAPKYALRYARALVGDGKLLAAESTLISSLRIEAGNFDVLSTLGDVYLRMDDLPRAQKVSETLAKLNDSRGGRAANLLKTEILARRVGPAQALEFLEGLVESNGGLVAKTALIQAQLQAGQTQAALSFAKAAVEGAPDNLQMRAALAMTFAAVRDFDAAVAEIETVLEQSPKAAGLYIQLARIRGAQGDQTAGQAAIQRGLDAIPGAPDLLWAQASYLQGAGDIDGAIGIYEGLYARNSSNPIVANNLASLLATHRDDEVSLQRAEVIARRLKNDDLPAFQDTYGWVLFRTGAVRDAIPYLEAAAAGLPEDVLVQFHLGQAYASSGDKEKALVKMRGALGGMGPFGDTDLRLEIETEIAHLSSASVQE